MANKLAGDDAQALQLARVEGAARDLQPLHALVNIGIERRPQRTEIDRARDVLEFGAGKIRRRPAQRFLHAVDLGGRRRQPHAVSYPCQTLDFVGLDLGVEVAAIVEIKRHRIDIAARPRRRRQPRQNAKRLLHALHDVNERPALGHRPRPRQRQQRAMPDSAENPAALAAQLGARRLRRALFQQLCRGDGAATLPLLAIFIEAHV